MRWKKFSWGYIQYPTQLDFFRLAPARVRKRKKNDEKMKKNSSARRTKKSIRDQCRDRTGDFIRVKDT